MSSNIQEVVISAQGLSKCYQIYDKPNDRLKQFVAPRIQKFFGVPIKQYGREFWALRDLSFEIKKGETFGIIGRNGAGKSTLLQILCGTLTPTSGEINVNGRVAALLELGAGFNQEFTGRENIYMNAGILGLLEHEIEERFQDIVSFADIGDFLDQPVKTYSSGMFVRLAFAIAAHVDADVLIVDEALSVGDVYFQAKCIEHLKKLMSRGVTLLFVSHDTSAVKALCSRAMYLDHGRMLAIGGTEEVVEAYYGHMIKRDLQDSDINKKVVDEKISYIDAQNQEEFNKRVSFHRVQNGKVSFLNIQLLDVNETVINESVVGEQVTLRMFIKAYEDMPLIGMGYHIRDKNGFDIIYSDTGIEHKHLVDIKQDEIIICDWTFNTNLRAGDYTIAVVVSVPIDLSIAKAEICDWIPVAQGLKISLDKHLPIHAAVYWPNHVEIKRNI